MSHFLEHLLFKGSKQRSALQIAEAIDVAGGDMNAFTTKESTAFYVRVLSEDTAMALDILCDIMCEPAFDPNEIEAERQVVLEEILMRNDEPADLAHELLSGALFADHPLGREILGDERQINDMHGDAIQAFFDHHYRPQNLVFAAAGRLNHDWLVEQIQTNWRGRDGGGRPLRVRPQCSTGKRIVHKRPTDQAHLVFGVPAPNRHDHERYATALLDTVMGGGMSSRLFQEIREQRGLAYTVYSGFDTFDDAGEFSIYLGTNPQRVTEAVDTVVKLVDDVRTNGVTNDELLRAKRQLKATTALGLEDSGARMSRIGRSLLLHGDVLPVDEVTSRIEAVTLDEVRALASKLFTVEPCLVAVGPLSNI